jgi:16S rRNA (guanine(966)-N(2))-methyltransferase RsmD
MRVISGVAKGRKLTPVPGQLTRPITDRVKEALFDIIGPDVVDSSWWDMFAGTGAVGIEALSRRASFARFTDLGRGPVDTIRLNLARTGLAAHAEVRRADAFAMLATPPDRQFDYIYVAPPQYRDLWSRALLALDENTDWLDPAGWIVVQIDPQEDKTLALRNLQEFDRRRYGTTLLTFRTRSEA